MSAVPHPLTELLRNEVAHRGPISFREFMAQALYHPQYGYYGSGRARIGRRGDFFTNVSVGSLFGTLLARQFVEMWQRLEAPAEFTIVEQGGHYGEFAADALNALREFAPACFAATTYRLVEPLAALRARQQETLAAFRVDWVESLAELPPFVGVHFSNELLDAFPVHRVVWTSDRWMERVVDFQENRFVFVDAPLANAALASHLARLPAVPPGYETEVNLTAAGWLTALAAKLEAGFVLAIDYGYPRAEYYRPERTGGTLSASAGHRREPDPLARPGEIDLTAHVDFTTLAETASVHGLDLAGFTDQHHFMVGLGGLHFHDDASVTTRTQQEIRAFKTLMHPDLMGRSFKTICFAKRVRDSKLNGFHFARNAAEALCGQGIVNLPG